MPNRRITVTRETESGLNTHFNVPGRGEVTRGRLADEVQRGQHDGYHVRCLNDGRRIIASNPNGREDDNLG